MPYQPIRTDAELAARLVSGVTREDHWLDFKGLDANGRPYTTGDKGKEECRLDVAQFANEGGGTIVIGAIEQDHVLKSFSAVPSPQELVRWIDEVVKEKLEPTPAIEPYSLHTTTGEEVVVVNIPPSLRLISLRVKDGYEFPVRTADSRRYLRLSEIEARMQDRDRVHRLQMEQIGPNDPVGLDGTVDRDLGHDDWRVGRVGENVVTLKKGQIEVPIPLVWVEAIYKAGLHGAEWMIALSCYLSKHRQRAIVVATKAMPHGRNQGRYRSRGMAGDP